MASFVVHSGGESIRYVLNDSELLIGRHPDCAIRFDTGSLSRKHARVVKEGARCFLEDLASRNGTKVNGDPITERVLLQDGDSVEFGYVISARFESGSDDDMPASSDIFEETMDAEEVQHATKLVGLDILTQTEAKAVLEIGRGLVGTIDLPSLFPRILDVLFQIFPTADRGCIFLEGEQAGKMVLRAVKQRRDGIPAVRLSRTIMDKVLNEKKGILSEDAMRDSQFDASQSIVALSIRSLICVPMLGLNGEPVGIISLDSASSVNRFRDRDLDLLMVVAQQVALSYENVRLLENYLEQQQERLELERQANELKQFFSPKVVEALRDTDIEAALEPTVVDITVLFCDIRGFSLRVERMSRNQPALHNLLERCGQALELMTHHILEFGGCISDFQGDAALGYWGWPVPPEDGPIPACQAALAIHAEFAKAQQTEGHPLSDFHIGIGIAHGPAIAGKIGCKNQAKIGVFGPVVNLGSRLEGITKELRAPILLDEPTGNYVRANMPEDLGRCRRLGRVRPYGLDTPTTVHQLLPPLADCPEILDEHIVTSETAVDAYTGGDWSSAFDMLGGLPVVDRAKEFIMDTIALHDQSPPPDWDGIHEMSHK